MKLVVISDIHNHYSLHSLNEKKVDCLLLLGDIGFDDEDKITSFLKQLKSIADCFYTIPGNIDIPNIESLLNELKINANKNKINVDSYNIIGLGGEHFDKEDLGLLRELIDENSIVLTHVPPYSSLSKTYFNTNIGEKRFTDIIKEKQPLLWLSGHVHERIGFYKIYNTLFIKVPPYKNNSYAIINIYDKENIEVEFKISLLK